MKQCQTFFILEAITADGGPTCMKLKMLTLLEERFDNLDSIFKSEDIDCVELI